MLTIVSGSLDLPVRPAAIGDEWRFEAPEGAESWRIHRRREGDSKRRREENLGEGTSVMIMENDHGEVEDLDHGLRSGSRSSERWTIAKDDPLGARADIEWETSMGRGDWIVSTRCRASMRATETHFLVSRQPGGLGKWKGGFLENDGRRDRKGLRLTRGCLIATLRS